MTVATDGLAERFEGLEIPAGSFRHRDHVETAHAMLLKYPFLEAVSRYAATIHTMATNAGAHDKFHVTVTVAFLSIIAERLEASRIDDFEEFARRNPDLFDSALLSRFYSPEQLASAAARRVFVMPSRP